MKEAIVQLNWKIPAIALMVLIAGCSKDKEIMSDDLQIEDLVVGEGAEVKQYDIVNVNYTGSLTNGNVFDSSLNPGRSPFRFTVGAGQVIKGWDEGLIGMKVGGKRKLTIPPNMGYGNRQTGPIPANSVLIFEIDLLSIE
tara:strand:- start:39 stop:458 length:420 start_codon:yes stop_codon:yes gene_type:complete